MYIFIYIYMCKCIYVSVHICKRMSIYVYLSNKERLRSECIGTTYIYICAYTSMHDE
jgi:hypothetical protein